jgi:hypothetical protein
MSSKEHSLTLLMILYKRHCQVTPLKNMTYEEALIIVSQANLATHKLFIESASPRQETDGTYSVIIEPVDGDEQIYSDYKKASQAILGLLKEGSTAGYRYFAISGGMPVPCEQADWENDAPNRAKMEKTVQCSPDIEAKISFRGCASPLVDMDGEVKLWAVHLTNPKTNDVFGSPALKSLERCNVFVERFIDLGCQQPQSLQWNQLLAGFQDG